MKTSTIILIVLCMVIASGIFLYYYRKRNTEKLFNQVFENLKQVPKQKKNSFLLLMFKESVASSKRKTKKNSKSRSMTEKFNNPKYVEIQLIQMANILKDTSKNKDKKIKSALILFNEYLKWEKKKIAKDKVA